MKTKPKLSFWQIWNMNFGFFGIQFSFGLQQSNMSAIYKFLGATEHELPLLWLAGPITGLLVQPIIGAISDGTWSPKFGRRKPFFLMGAILASVALLIMPYSSSIWMAASLLWILDAGNNIALEPYRAFVSDKLPEKQYALGFSMQSFFTGLGATLSNFTPAILIGLGVLALTDKMDNGIPVSTYWAFAIGAIASIATVLYSVLTTKEYPPTEEELIKIAEEKKKGNVFKRAIIDIVKACKSMPKTMVQLIPMMFFTWYAMFCYWQYLTSALSLSLFQTVDETTEGFLTSQVLTGSINGSYNIMCVIIAFALVPLANKIGAQRVHFAALLLGGSVLLMFPLLGIDNVIIPIGEGITISSIYLISLGLGISWASMMAMPYVILARAVPKNKMGIYMGIFNMFIVIPMIIQIFSMQFFVYDLLSANPINVVLLAGVLLILGGISSLFIQVKKEEVL